MSRIVISGYYGFHNLGDEAVLAATVAELTRRRPGAELVVLSGAPEETSRVHGVSAIPRGDPRAVTRALRGADLFLSGGGSLFQDATSWRSPWYYLSVLAAARRLAGRTSVYAQGFERVHHAPVRMALAYLLNRVDLITVRDSASQGVLAEIGVRRPRIVLSADPTVLLSPLRSSRVEAEQRRWGNGPLFGLAMRPWGAGVAAGAAAAAARTITARLGVRWVLLPMHPPLDLAVAEMLADGLGDAAIVVRESFTPGEMLALIGGLDVLVGMRLHALVFAAIQGVPIVPIAYDPKVAALTSDLGMPEPMHADRVRPDTLTESIESIAAGRENERRRLLTVLMPLRHRASLAPQLAVELMS